MDQVHVIRHKVLVEGRSERSVARDLGVSRNTVRKYLEIAEPRRVEASPRAKPVLGRVVARLEELLTSWRTTRKQRVTGARLHRQLVEEGHSVGVTTVRQYLREWRRQREEVYVPLVHRPGEAGQVDFFEATVIVGGEVQKAWQFLLYLPFSGRTFGWLYLACDTLSFLEGHVRAFAHLGGVPARLVYDNLKPAVKRRVGVERELQARFRALVSHYLFEPCFARPGEGHDKGAVEGRGKGVRLQHLVPVPSGPSLAAVSAQLVASLERHFFASSRRDGREPEVLWAQERAQLRELPTSAFEPRQVVLVEVSSKATVQILGATYSVPSRWARRSATAYVGVEDVRLVCGEEQTDVARAAKGVRRIQYQHYLGELSRKPQAVRQVAPELVAELGEPFGRLWALLSTRHGALEGARLLAKVLGAVEDHGVAAVAEAVTAGLQADRCDLLALHRLASKPVVAVQVPVSLRGIEIERREAREYDALLVGGMR
jgi:transposase